VSINRLERGGQPGIARRNYKKYFAEKSYRNYSLFIGQAPLMFVEIWIGKYRRKDSEPEARA
jgi:hypothetical protein